MSANGHIEQEHFEHLFQSSPVAVVVLDGQDRVVDCNLEFTRLFGYTMHETVGCYLNELISSPEMMAEASALSQVTLSGGRVDKETKRRRKDGTVIDVAITGAPREIGGHTYVYGIYQDITEKKRAEEQVAALLREKEMLLKETHHRVKNNMSVISSLLGMQASLHEGSRCEHVLQDAAARVQSMLVLYDKLYQAESTEKLGIRDYLPALMDEILSLFRDTVPVQTNLELENFELSSRSLMPLGIIINELITNSIKYAFKWRNDGRISVSVQLHREAGQDMVHLVYEDNGSGLPAGVGFHSSSGFGLELVGMLVEQLSGTAHIESENGTRFVFNFPL
ncbi:MAG: PAS domain S-box protein [Spirochaeta sp.]|nr:PAS domain S-box protein [Spirochaeta sp.]